MRKITAVFVILSAFMLLPGLAFAQHPHDITEYVAITATAATADQTSAMIKKPQGARGVVAWLEVTAGSTLLLDINMDLYSPTVDEWQGITADCPTDGAATGIGRVICFYSPDVGSGIYVGKEASIAVPTLFRFWVDHGNANAATYVLYYQWLW